MINLKIMCYSIWFVRCVVAVPMAMSGAYMSIFKNKYFWIGIVAMIATIIVYYKDCDKCKA